MQALRLALALVAVCALPGCDPAYPEGDDGIVRVRFYGDGVVDEACEAQSQCGFGQRCVHRGDDARSELPPVEQGRCELDSWPGGCFALLPPHPASRAEGAEARAKGQKGLPVHRVCQ